MSVLLTRPVGQNEALAKTLKKRGFSVQFAPMLNIVPVPEQPDITGIQALLATSGNGVSAFAARSDRRDIPLFAVGMATADLADQLEFDRTEAASGDVAALSRLVTARLKPENGAVLHLSGDHIRGNLEESLADAGFVYRRVILYEAKPAIALPDDVVTLLRAGKIDHILFFSPRTAETFAGLITDAGLKVCCKTVTAVCLSDAVADAAGKIAWRDVIAAKLPQQSAMIDVLDAIK